MTVLVLPVFKSCPTVRWQCDGVAPGTNNRHTKTSLRLMSVASAQLIDIASLVSPLAGEQPGGDGRAYVRELRSQFSELRNPPVSSNPDDHDANTNAREPDWQAIYDLAIESLQTRTKDIRIACHLAEANMHLSGLQGLADGLELIARMLDEAWDYLIPEIDPEDPEVRSSPIENLLNDPDRGPCLPLAIKALPIIGQGEQRISLQDATRRGPSDDDKNKVQVAISSCTADQGRDLVQQQRAALQQLQAVKSILTEKLETAAPSLTNLSDSLDMVGRWLVNCFGQSDESAQANNEDAENGLVAADCMVGESPEHPITETQSKNASHIAQDPASVLRLSVQMRNDAYRKLTEAATVLQQIEPHSPIPYMIHRAVRLGQMPFPDLVGKLVREESALQSIRGEFGLSSDDEDRS